MINNKTKQLIEAERKALFLFDEIEKKGLIISNKTETELNKEIFELAFFDSAPMGLPELIMN